VRQTKFASSLVKFLTHGGLIWFWFDANRLCVETLATRCRRTDRLSSRTSSFVEWVDSPVYTRPLSSHRRLPQADRTPRPPRTRTASSTPGRGSRTWWTSLRGPTSPPPSSTSFWPSPGTRWRASTGASSWNSSRSFSMTTCRGSLP